jgi:hypothetical protein
VSTTSVIRPPNGSTLMQGLVHDHHFLPTGCDGSHSLPGTPPEIQIKNSQKLPMRTIKPLVSGFTN